MEIGKGARGGIQKIKNGVHHRTCFSYPRHRQENESEGRHIRLCDGGSIINKRQEWKVEASDFHL